MDNPFVPGDVVVLKSGGPRMTVETVGTQHGELHVNCVWFERSTPKRMDYAPAVLKKAPQHHLA